MMSYWKYINISYSSSLHYFTPVEHKLSALWFIRYPTPPWIFQTLILSSLLHCCAEGPIIFWGKFKEIATIKKYIVTMAGAGQHHQLNLGDTVRGLCKPEMTGRWGWKVMIGDEATESLRGVWQAVAALSGGLEKNQVMLADERQGWAVKRCSVCSPVCF